MVAIEIGKVCTVLAGRRSGEEVVITNLLDENFVTAKMKNGKDRKFAILHLNPTDKKDLG